MTERSDRIRLAPDVARCEPSKGCAVRTRCARAQATVPTHGASMADFSVATPNGGTYLCPGYISITAAAPTPSKPEKPVRPAVRGLG